MTKYDIAATLSPLSSFNIFLVSQKKSVFTGNQVKISSKTYLNMPFITQTHGSQNDLHFPNVFTCADCRNM